MKRCIITGGNQGMGLDFAKHLAGLGWSVVISVRSAEKGEQAVADIKASSPKAGDVTFGVMDLNDLSSVATFAAAYTQPAVDVLICNAGIMNTPFALSKDGIEQQYQSNHLGHFKLIHHLLPKLRAAGSARVVSLSSRAHLRHPDAIDYDRLKNESAETYDGWIAYGRSKLSQILMSKALAARFPQSTGVCFYANHPGVVNTGLIAKGAPAMTSSAMPVEDGIKTTMLIATAPGDAIGPSGTYWHNDRPQSDRDVMTSAPTPGIVTEIAFNNSEADNCFAQSCKMIGIAGAQAGLRSQRSESSQTAHFVSPESSFGQ